MKARFDFADNNPNYQIIDRAVAKVPTIVTVYLDRQAKLNSRVAALLANFRAGDRPPSY
jgi:hypothetical protein